MAKHSNTVIKGISSQTVVTIVLGVVEIVSFSIMSRLLTKEDFGYYSAIVAISAIFAVLADSGIGSSIVQRKHLDDSYVNAAFSLSFLFGLTAFFLLLLFSGFLARIVADDSLKEPLMYYSVTLVFQSLSSVNISLLQRDLKFIHIGLINVSALVITTVIASILAIYGFGYYAIMIKAILTSVIVFLGTLHFVKRRFSFVISIPLFKEIYSFSGWLFYGAFFRQLSAQVDRLLMSSLLTINSLGIYSRPKEFISQVSTKICTIFDVALFPILSSFQDEKDQLRHKYLLSVFFMGLTGVVCSIALAFNSELLILVFFGQEWLSVNSLLIVLSFSVYLFMNGRIGDIFLRSLALTKQQFFFRVIQFVLTSVFVIVGARWDIMGIAIASLLSYYFIAIIKLLYVAKFIKIPIPVVMTHYFSPLKCLLLYVPALLLINGFLPYSLSFCFVKFGVFSLLTILMFIIFPRFIGKEYTLVYDYCFQRFKLWISQKH